MTSLINLASFSDSLVGIIYFCSDHSSWLANQLGPIAPIIGQTFNIATSATKICRIVNSVNNFLVDSDFEFMSNTLLWTNCLELTASVAQLCCLNIHGLLRYYDLVEMFLRCARFTTIWATNNSSLVIVIFFFDNLGLLAINHCLIPDGCCMTA